MLNTYRNVYTSTYNTAKSGGCGLKLNAKRVGISKVSRSDAVSLTMTVYENLKQSITTMELMPGTILYELDTSKRFGVSRTPVREAFRMLEAERLVTIIPRRGAQVTQISRESLADAYEARLWVECAAVAKAATRVNNETLAQLEEILARTPKDPVTHKDALAFEECDLIFHDIIIRCADNSYVTEYVSQLRSTIQRAAYFVPPGRYQRSWQEHREILDALRDRDSDKAVLVTTRHIQSARSRMLG